MTFAYEVNFDGLVGPTHNYAGLSKGNIKSEEHRRQVSSPKEAALECLEKMKFLHDLGIHQAVLPPHERPHIPTLRALGFSGQDAQILEKAAEIAPELLAACSSSSSMWAANAATITPSIDSLDSHVHITPANLTSTFHRSIEVDTTTRILRTIFSNKIHFKIHDPLPKGAHLSDEGSANHTRFCNQHGGPGVHLFVFGKYGFRENALEPARYPARQSCEAFESIARRHQIFPDRLLVVQQSPRAIDAGVFHNDVASLGNGNVFLYHEHAFVGTDTVAEEVRKMVQQSCRTDLTLVKVPETKLPLDVAVKSYFFNSQLVTLPNGSIKLICPTDCHQVGPARDYIHDLLEDPDNPIVDVHYVSLEQSMNNGGGPACLRMRTVLTKEQVESMKQGIIFTDRLYDKLKAWIKKHYRDELKHTELKDPELLKESRNALDELTKILDLGSIYEFQQR